MNTDSVAAYVEKLLTGAVTVDRCLLGEILTVSCGGAIINTVEFHSFRMHFSTYYPRRIIASE